MSQLNNGYLQLSQPKPLLCCLVRTVEKPCLLLMRSFIFVTPCESSPSLLCERERGGSGAWPGCPCAAWAYRRASRSRAHEPPGRDEDAGTAVPPADDARLWRHGEMQRGHDRATRREI